MTTAPDIDGDRLLREAEELSFPRYPGSEGDARAIARVAESLRGAGLEVRVEPFDYDVRPAFRWLRAILITAGLLLAAAGLAADRSPGLGLLFLLLASSAAAGLLLWAPGLERLYQRGGPARTANVEGRRSASPRRLTLILVAHHDSKSQNLTLPVRMGLTLAALAGAGALAVALVAALFAGGPSGPVWLAPGCGTVSAVALLILATLRSGNRSPGAVDNAGSVAILCELARLLPAELPADVELVFLSTGAEEDHMVGAMRWLDLHQTELEQNPVLAVNLDGAGAPGRLVALERFGLGRRFSPLLSRAARRAAAELGERLRGVLLPPAMGVDAIPFAHRGIDCLTVSSGSLDRAVLAVHSPGDRPEHLDRDTLVRAARLVRLMALDVASSRPGAEP